MQYEVSSYVGRILNQRKVRKWLSFKNSKSESLKMYDGRGEHVY